MDNFRKRPGFCPDCGSIFPSVPAKGNITCYNCKREYNPSVFGEHIIEYDIHFNTYVPKIIDREAKVKPERDEADGPVVERKCPKCGNDKMSYATLQLRSADEGQTVFFTCVKCRYKESENS